MRKNLRNVKFRKKQDFFIRKNRNNNFRPKYCRRCLFLKILNSKYLVETKLLNYSARRRYNDFEWL